jgi:hypothetical protein
MSESNRCSLVWLVAAVLVVLLIASNSWFGVMEFWRARTFLSDVFFLSEGMGEFGSTSFNAATTTRQAHASGVGATIYAGTTPKALS